MRVEIAHGLSQELARTAARRAVAEYAERFERYAPAIDWKDDDRAQVSFGAKGLTLSGSFSLQPGRIVFEMDVPFLLRPLAGKAKDVVEERVRQWVARAERGELE